MSGVKRWVRTVVFYAGVGLVVFVVWFMVLMALAAGPDRVPRPCYDELGRPVPECAP